MKKAQEKRDEIRSPRELETKQIHVRQFEIVKAIVKCAR